MKTTLNHSSENGFSLIEAMVAIVFLTVSLLGLAQLLTISVQRYSYARNDTKSIHIAESKVEELKTIYEWQIDTSLHSDLLLVGSHGPVLVSGNAPQETSGETNAYWVSWNVTDLQRGLKKVEVTVTPPNPNTQINATVTVSSVFAP